MALPFLLRGGLLSKTGSLGGLVRHSSLLRTAAVVPAKSTLLKGEQSSLVQTLSRQNFHVTPVRKAELMSPPVHWVTEKALSGVLYFAIPAAIIMPGNIYLDNIAVVSALIHSHWGLDNIFIDYVRPKLFGPIIPGLVRILLVFVTIFALGSMLYFNYNDVGFGNAVRAFWTYDYSEDADK